MNKSTVYKVKPGFSNKAEELRQLKLKKLEDNNIKISKQLDRSADSWKNSMEQIRKIAKKAQDSSQILDNVFTENENDRSEIESDIPKYHHRPPIAEPRYYRSNLQHYGSFQPISQHANYASNYFNPNRTYDLDNMFPGGYQPYNIDMHTHMKNMHSFQNMNQSNATTYPQPIPQRFIYPEYRPMNSWHPGVNQSNTTLGMPFTNSMNYNPSFQRPLNFYPQSPFPNMLPLNPNYYQPPPMLNPYLHQYRPYPPPKDDGAGIESMKKYVNSLLDKLELLNNTVAKLKNENLNNNSRLRTCSHNYDSCDIPNRNYHDDLTFYPQNYCCSRRKPISQIQRSCSCRELYQNISRRPPSSMSERNPYSTFHNCNHNQIGISTYKNPHHNCNFSCYRTQTQPRPYREPTIIPERKNYNDNNYYSSSNRFNHIPVRNHESNHNTNSSVLHRPQTPSTINDNNNHGVTLVVDNSNNNNLTDLLIDSSDKASDLLSISEIPDTTM